MRRAGNLFEQIVALDNLRHAFQRAARGKRHRAEVAAFQITIDERLADMSARLQRGEFPVGRFRQFEIHDPKRRIITAPAFPERVLHHAIIRVCEPHLERWLIADTYACRPGKGREAAVLRAAGFARRFPWRLHLDVRQYFDSIPHDTLLACLGRRFKDPRLLELFQGLIAGFRGTAGRGLPIGSLMSQHFANLYLGWLDRFVKESLRIPGYVRYMDDLVVWGGSRHDLVATEARCRDFSACRLGLEFKPSSVAPSSRGLGFLGCRIFQTHTELSPRSRRRYRRRVRSLVTSHRLGLVNDRQIQVRLEASTAFVQAAGVKSWRFRDAVLKSISVGDP